MFVYHFKFYVFVCICVLISFTLDVARCASNLTRSLLMFPLAVVTRCSYRRLSHWLLHFRQLPVYIRRTATSPYPDKTRTCSSYNNQLFCSPVLYTRVPHLKHGKNVRIIFRIMLIARLIAVVTFILYLSFIHSLVNDTI